MSKKILISAIAIIALFGASLPAVAQEAEEDKEKPPMVVPEQPEISDPPGDSNTWGGDWQSGNLPIAGSDILKAWFTNDAETVSVHLQTEAPPGGTGLLYRVYVNPNNAVASSSSSNCVRFEAGAAGLGNPNGDFGRVNDSCGDAGITDGEVAFEELPDGTGVVTITVPRTASPSFEKDSILFVPWAESRQYAGVLVGLLDNTKPGADYTVVGELVAPKKEEPEEGEEGEEGEEEPEEEPEEEEEPEQSEPPKKKKGKKAKGCDPWTPGEMGAEAETTVVTEEATEEKPLEVPIEVAGGIYPATADTYHNIQVDTAGGEKALFVRFEFPSHEDLDLYLYDAAGEEVAQAAGFNPAPYGPLDDTSGGGHSEMGAEQIDGLMSADCVGVTAELHAFISEGGEMMVKLWLADPAAEEEEE